MSRKEPAPPSFPSDIKSITALSKPRPNPFVEYKQSKENDQSEEMRKARYKHEKKQESWIEVGWRASDEVVCASEKRVG